MKATEKEKAEWAALGRRRDSAPPPPAKKEDPWSALGRGRQNATASSMQAGHDQRKLAHEDSSRLAREDSSRLAREDSSRFAREDSSRLDRGESFARLDRGDDTPSRTNGPPRFINSKKSSERPSWRDRLTQQSTEASASFPATEQELDKSSLAGPATGTAWSEPAATMPTTPAPALDPSWCEQLQAAKATPATKAPSWRDVGAESLQMYGTPSCWMGQEQQDASQGWTGGEFVPYDSRSHMNMMWTSSEYAAQASHTDAYGYSPYWTPSQQWQCSDGNLQGTSSV